MRWLLTEIVSHSRIRSSLDAERCLGPERALLPPIHCTRLHYATNSLAPLLLIQASSAAPSCILLFDASLVADSWPRVMQQVMMPGLGGPYLAATPNQVRPDPPPPLTDAASLVLHLFFLHITSPIQPPTSTLMKPKLAAAALNLLQSSALCQIPASSAWET